MLTPFFDANSYPTAGLRQEIPTYLMGLYTMLKMVSYDQKKKHGKQTKAFVKLDKHARSLYLDIGLQGYRNWIMINQEMAQEIRRDANRGKFRLICFIKQPRTGRNDNFSTTKRKLIGSEELPPPRTILKVRQVEEMMSFQDRRQRTHECLSAAKSTERTFLSWSPTSPSWKSSRLALLVASWHST